MSAQPQRSLVDRWYFGILPAAWDGARSMLQRRLENLARIVSVLHSAVEHPGPTVDDVAVSTIIFVTSTTDAALTGAGTTFTPEVNMRAVVTAHAPMKCTAFGAITHIAIISLYVNGVAQAGTAQGTFAQVNEISTGSQSWVVTMAAGTEYTLQLYGKTQNAATQYVVGAATRMLVMRFPDLFTLA